MLYQWKVLQKTSVLLATAIFLAGVSAIYLSGFSSETLRTFTNILRKISEIMFCLLLLVFIIYLLMRKKDKIELSESRDRCFDAYDELFAHLTRYCLEGYDNLECRRLQAVLEDALERHIQMYPAEIRCEEILYLLTYNKEVKELEKVW